MTPEFAINEKSAIADLLVTETGQQYLQRTPDFIKALQTVSHPFVPAEADVKHQGVLYDDNDGKQ